MHTDDLATMDEEGYIQIVGRIKDIVIRGGENIYPKEVEEFLCIHPFVEEMQVTGKIQIFRVREIFIEDSATINERWVPWAKYRGGAKAPHQTVDYMSASMGASKCLSIRFYTG